MAFGSLLCVPANIGPNFRYSNGLSAGNGLEIDFVPTLAAGTKFDLTAATAYTVNMDNGLSPTAAQYLAQQPSNSKLTGGATGGSLSIAAADVKTAILALQAKNGATSGSISVSATDGTNDLIVATGTWTANYVA